MDLPLPTLSQIPQHYRDCCLSLSSVLLETLTALIISTCCAVSSTRSNTAGKSCSQPTGTHRPRRGLVLSVGSGTGLLEAHLLESLNRLGANINDGVAPLPTATTSGSRSTMTTRVHPDPEFDYRSSESGQFAQPTNDLPKHLGFWVEGVEVRLSTDHNSSLNRYLPGEAMHIVEGTWDICEERAIQADAWLFVYPRDTKLVERYFGLVAGQEAGAGGQQAIGNRDKAQVKLAIFLGPRNDWEVFRCVFGIGDGWEVEEPGRETPGLASYETMAVAKRTDPN